MLGGTAMLEVWERGQRLTSTGRALSALQVWQPDGTDGSLAFDEFIRRLLNFRAEHFGSTLEFYAQCECGTAVEFAVSVEDLGDSGNVEASRHSTGEEGLRVVTEEFGELELTCAPPRVDDVDSATHSSDPARALFEACVVQIAASSSSPTTADLPDDLIEAVEQWLDDRHPMLDITLGVTCPDCAASWTEILDVPAHVWADIDVEVKSLLADVAVLARAYQWSERDLLEMSKQRRDYYIEAIA